MLVARMPGIGRRLNSFWIALPGSLVALWLAAPWRHLQIGADGHFASTPIFDGLLIYDPLTVYFRGVLLLFAVLFFLFTKLSGIPDREDSPDFYTLVLGGLLGMCVMASANHMLTVFLGVEMASVPSYALSAFLKGRRTAGEAGLKYAVYGAGAAGVMLYGISLLGGALGSVHIPTMTAQLAHLSPEAWADRQIVLMTGGLMVGVGLAFKLSAVPFHFWAPDVFEGACAEVNAFLSVASKAGAMALLIRVALGFSHEAAAHDVPQPIPAVTQAAASPFQLASAKEPTAVSPEDDDSDHVHESNLTKARKYIAGLIALLAAITCTFGNLAAYGQTNIKRLLAYSTIAHAGYMMMPVAAAVALVGSDVTSAREAVAGLCFYVGTYLFTNLAAFAIVAFLRNSLRSEEIADYAGLIKRSPGIAICFTTVLVSLIGLPPLAGFVAKLFAFSPLVKAEMWYLLLIGGVNTAISLFYYIRVIKTMTIDPESADRAPASFSMTGVEGVYVALITLPVLILGVWFNSLREWALAAASSLL
ncbi:MAG: NADH-quinone oxidoreductase subunit N [Pirellulales bacterium]